VQLNRAGRIHVTGSTVAPVGWDTVIAAPGGHDIVRRIEAAVGIVAPATAPPTGPATLTYRLLARTLASLIDNAELPGPHAQG
jgi:hypothetical protein